ncbi:Clavaminate synthase-like protein [Aureobasidium pullulans]|nr:Clavaminate synthase-like protein [Aureobasidium pullulans]
MCRPDLKDDFLLKQPTMSSTTVIEAPTSHKLELHTAYGPVYRDVLNTEPRDATEEEQNTEAKEQVSQDKSKYYNGWKAPRSTNISRTESVDVKESFSWRYQPENDPDHPQPLSCLPAEVQPWIRGEEFVWQGTSHLPDFKSDVLNYWKSCLQLARQLVKVFALSLDLPEDYFDTRTTFPGADGVMNYYPITTAEETASNAVGLGSHTDLQLFTLLWQDEVGGLQVLTKDGQWIKATPKPGTFVVNIGDFMMRLSNDFFKSTVHRVYNRAKVERVSMPFFFGELTSDVGRAEAISADSDTGLNFNCVEGVIPTCTSEDDPPRYEPISCGDVSRSSSFTVHQITNLYTQWCQLRFKLEAERMAKKLAEQDATTKLIAK